MREVWRDWSIEWAHEGVVDVAERAGVPREHVLTEGLETGTDDLRPPEQPDWMDLVGSVRRPDGTVRLFPLAGEVWRYVAAGPALADALRREAGVPTLHLEERTEFLSGGFHVDVQARLVDVWTASPQPDLPRRLATVWPGKWTVVWHRDAFEVQLMRTSGALRFPRRDAPHLLERTRELLLRNISRSGADIVREVMAAKTREGHDVQVNPFALRHDRLPLGVPEREAILSRALAALEG